MDMQSLSRLEQQKGCVHLYVGDGKGKTTTVAGLAVRYLGQGGKVLFCQFLKGRESGELESLRKLGAEIRRCKYGAKFTFQMSEEELEQTRQSHTEELARAAQDAKAGRYGLIVLDEVVDAVNCGVAPLEMLLGLIDGRAPFVEVVMTGRNPPAALEAAADYHTDYVCKKHPYREGVSSRPGVEY